MQISTRQNEVTEHIRNRKEIILLTGVIGSSKTFTAAVVAISMAKQYPGAVIGVGKKNRIEITSGTAYSFEDTAEEMGVHDYTTNMQLLHWKFANGSRIQFYELDQTKDRQFNKTKKMELTCNIIDEADAVVEDGFWAAHGRVGRKNNCKYCGMTPKDMEVVATCLKSASGEHNAPPAFTLLTCNPNEAWIKNMLYDPYKKPEEFGELPSEMAVVEFFQQDSFLGRAYYQKYRNAPNQFVQRYLLNNWDYGDDEAALFKYRYMDRQHVQTYTKTTGFIGKDVARTGKDRSVIALWYGRCLVDIKIIKDKEEKIDTSIQGDMLKEYALDNEVGYDRIAVDAVGVGVGVVDHLKSMNYYVNEFMSGAAPSEPKYNNLRSEMAFRLSQDIEKGLVTFYDGCPYLKEFKKEATSHNYETKDKQFILESKDKVKERLGFSPDLFDAVLMGYWMVCKYDGMKFMPKTSGDYNAKYEQKTVVRRRRGL